MTTAEKAKIILENLDKRMNVNWNMKDMYLRAIREGLNEIEKEEKRDEGGSNDYSRQ